MTYDRSRFYGMDPDEAEQGSRQMNEGAAQVRGMVDQISALLGEVVWEGADSQRFLGDWDGSLRPELHRAMTNLQQNADELGRRAQLQRQASS
ncbi:Proteins of 100 residues with WXG [Pedococcus dokdonensis]|uniref:Proteins of 100 residues with WXG n=1 Tax=Pedococcus dokdonensis TaxID=443156 RepID=A0A1H0R0V6_9MICO|nr:WXG100 family type VII secretion target [Pedococcus dokdonensis]SDP22809.1 Proteins of 100 residues with WXG [Pedococcus dokdonensis]